MAENHSIAFGRLVQPTIPFRSDSPHEQRFGAGHLSAFEDAALGAVVALVTPAGPGKPLRMALTFDDALQLAHTLIAASVRLHRSGGSEP